MISPARDSLIIHSAAFQIFENDGLPSLVCHKCLVLTENCMDFRDKCLKNDEKLRLIFKINGNADEAQEQEVVPEAPAEAEVVEEEEEEVITLNPNKLYESSDESDDERPEEPVTTVEHRPVAAPPAVNEAKPPVELQSVTVGNTVNKKEIFHCRYCDIVFSEKVHCINHELNNHNPMSPFQCAACSFSTDQYAHLISHSRDNHNAEKPYLCSQCTKSFVRRSDLKKHKFVHAGSNRFEKFPSPSSNHFSLPFQTFASTAATSATNPSHATPTSPSISERTRRT